MERAPDLHIAAFGARDNPEHFPPEHVTLAFSRLAQPVLVEKLRQVDNVELVQNALDACCRQYTVALNIVQAVEAGAVEALAKLVRHDDGVVRERATRALGLLLLNPTGRGRVIETGVLVVLRPVLKDPLPAVRVNMFVALQNLVAVADGAGDAVKHGYVAQLVDSAATDDESAAQELALRVLAKAVDAPEGKGLAAALEGGDTMRVCIALLDDGVAEVRAAAARVVATLAFADEGKKQAIEGGAVAPLIGLAEDALDAARAEAGGALMLIVVDNKGKEALIAAGLSGLIALLGDANTVCQLNAMRTVATVAAHPRARAQLQELDVLEHLHRIRDDGNALLRRCAETAIRAVEWTP
uniref:Uncharacterized protein n=1 Tax=Bicosoecida sp. CB-2014 TaxID=1486930 RepID=A0A7S1GE52_9STRA|mmetsp:Transcript_7007/g.24917  ORF Transcript_7007/g.24917 Transcript_7007/m.24917 type:complete len:356 (+) Transcript_7007:184-1251(+)